MTIEFTKMHGLGNDFVVINNLSQTINFTPELTRALADRRYGVGCDQVLILEKSDSPDADFNYRIFNADGYEVYQCGNGARCIGLFVKTKKLSDKPSITLKTANNLMAVSVKNDNSVTVDMGVPDFNPKSLPFITTQNSAPYSMTVDNQHIALDVVSVGNPHCVIRVNDFAQINLEKLGSQLQNSPSFPEGVNVGLMEIVSPTEINLRVFERGAGLTQACGSGACAAMVCGRAQHGLSHTVTVKQPGGDVSVAWPNPGDHIQLKGTADTVFDGIWY